MEGLDKLDVSELPVSLINRSQKPLLLGFKYLHHPYTLVLEIKKHEELPVIGTVVDSASGVTLFTDDGKLVHRIVYQIRNTSKQFLELELPKGAQIWSVYLPDGYRYVHFGGTVEKEKMARGLRPLFGRRGKTVSYVKLQPEAPGEDKDNRERYRREAGQLKKQFRANIALSEEQLVEQMENETRFGQRVKDIQSGKVPAGGGILPIRIQIPTTGQLFRFAKTIVSEEPLTLSFNFLSNGTLWLLKIIALVIILIILFTFRRKIKKFIGYLRERYHIQPKSKEPS